MAKYKFQIIISKVEITMQIEIKITMKLCKMISLKFRKLMLMRKSISCRETLVLKVIRRDLFKWLINQTKLTKFIAKHKMRKVNRNR
jgi:hypothetical protein